MDSETRIPPGSPAGPHLAARDAVPGASRSGLMGACSRRKPSTVRGSAPAVAQGTSGRFGASRAVGRVSRRRNPTSNPRFGRHPMSDYAALIRPTQPVRFVSNVASMKNNKLRVVPYKGTSGRFGASRAVGRVSRRRNPTSNPRFGRHPMSDYAALIRPTQPVRSMSSVASMKNNKLRVVPYKRLRIPRRSAGP